MLSRLFNDHHQMVGVQVGNSRTHASLRRVLLYLRFDEAYRIWPLELET
jgi:hypothetical protein